MVSFKAKQLSRLLKIWALPFSFAAISPLGIALGQTAPASPIVSDVQVAGGTARVLFLGAREARAVLVLLPGGDGIIGLDTGGGIHQLGSNFLVRTFGQWAAQGFAVVLPDRHERGHDSRGQRRGASGLKGIGCHPHCVCHPPWPCQRDNLRCRTGLYRGPRARRQQRPRHLRGNPARRCTDGALGPDTLTAERAGYGSEQPDRQTRRPMRGDVAAWLPRDRGHGGAAHLRMDQSGWRALSTAYGTFSRACCSGD